MKWRDKPGPRVTRMYARWLPHLEQRIRYIGRTRRGLASIAHTISPLVSTRCGSLEERRPCYAPRRAPAPRSHLTFEESVPADHLYRNLEATLGAYAAPVP
jgi:hypothetical protein